MNVERILSRDGIYDFDYALKRLSLDPLIQVNKKNDMSMYR